MELVGRDAEWRAVETWLATRDPRVLVVHGEAGIGKTTLWSAAVGTARASGECVLAHTASWSEAQLPEARHRSRGLVVPAFRPPSTGA